MKAGIIAAGDGSRLKSEGIMIPKPLVQVDGVPLIERLLRSFIRCGISEVACIVNEYSLEVKQFVEDLTLNIPVQFVVKTTPSSMHSMFALAPYLHDSKFLLSAVDSIFDEKEFGSYLHHAQKRTADGVVAVTNFIDDENPLYVQLDASYRIQGFSKSDRNTWITGGLYVFSPNIFNEVDTVLQRGIERLRNYLGHLVTTGYVLEGYAFSKIVDVDHIQDIRTAESLLRSRA